MKHSAIASYAVLLVFLLGGSSVSSALPDSQARNMDAEFDQLAALLEVSEGSVVADVGAGGGTWAFRLAQRVGPQGRVYATEVKDPLVEMLRRAVETRRIQNMEVVLGSEQDMGLPPSCCDGLLLRLVYHAFRDPGEPERMRDSMRRAVKPGGLVLIADFLPSPAQLTEEMRSAGFDRVRLIDRWQDQDSVYAALFRKAQPLASISTRRGDAKTVR